MASHLAGLAVLREAAHVLAAERIELMPLKGIWLQQLVYPGPEERPITDVDVLVREAHYEPAIAALTRAGFRLWQRGEAEASFVLTGIPLALDLHRALFTKHAFALPTDEVIARGIADRASFEEHVLLPDPIDAFAHLVGHFIKSQGTANDTVHLRDFGAIARRFAIKPGDCARRLEAAGLGRAARYTLALASEVLGDELSRQTLHALAPDPLGSSMAAGCRQLMQRLPVDSPLRAAPGFLLDRSLAAGARAMAARALSLRGGPGGRPAARRGI